MKSIKKFSIYFISILLIVIDQITKILVINNIKNEPVNIIKHCLNFTYCENRGVAFSIGEGNVPIFIIVNIILIAGLIIYYEKNKNQFNNIAQISVSAIIAGGTSNLIDRIFRGFVVDFIDVNELIDFPIFNVADMCIVVGIIVLGVYFIWKK